MIEKLNNLYVWIESSKSLYDLINVIIGSRSCRRKVPTASHNNFEVFIKRI